MTDQNVICMKWGTLYSATYVNVLHAACRAASDAPFRFVCFTDDATGLHPDIDAQPIPDIGLGRADWTRGGCWPKVGLLDAKLGGLTGRCLFIDLDMVILRDLDAFFDITGGLVGVNGSPAWGRPGRTAPQELMSCILAFDAGALGGVPDAFRRDPQAAMSAYTTEQAFIEAHSPDLHFWPEDWVISFKRLLRRPMGLDLILPPSPPPKTAKIVAFHGTPRPIDLIDGKKRFWDRFPHMGNGQVNWMVDYWTRNGGTI